jgi:hypothetical protein
MAAHQERMSRMLERFWLTNQEDRKFECRVSDHKTERPAKLHRVMVQANPAG